VHVTAKDLGTGKSQSIKIVASQKLNEDEIERMRKEAEQHAAEDKKRKGEAETINEADAVTYSTEKLLEEMKGKGEKEKLEKVKKLNDELKELLEKEPKDAGAIRAKMDELSKKTQEIGTEIYRKAAEEAAKKQQGAQGSQGAKGSGEQGGEDNVVDADYEVKDDKGNK